MKLFNKRSKKQSVRKPKLDAESPGYVFRRSRTLTGTTSPKLAAGAESRSQLKTIRMQVHELHQLRRRVVRILGLLLIVIAALSWLVASYVSSIQITYTEAGAKPAMVMYQNTILQYFGQHPLERFGFAINHKQLVRDVQAAHPELASIDIDKNWYEGGVQFLLQFRRPVLSWETSGKRFYVDNQGVAFGYDHFGGRYVSVSDHSGISPSVSGGTVASNRFIEFLGRLVGAVNAGGKGSVTEIIIPASTRQVDLRLQGRGYVIKTHIDRDPLQQAQDIIHALKWFDEKKIIPQYIDVRVSGKAFFK